MTERTPIHRRPVLAGLLGAGAVFVDAGASGRDETTHQALFAFCLGLDCPVGIGEAAREALPRGEAVKQVLAGALLRDLSRASRGTAETLARRVRNGSRRDFAHGRVVSVEGWLLSRTEARVYALADLLRREKA